MRNSGSELVPVHVIGPELAHATGDERWRTFHARLIAGGKSNLTYELTSDAGSLILRRQPAGALLPSAHDMGRESRVQRALAGTDVPVPAIVYSELTGKLLGATFYVMQAVGGHIIRSALPGGYAASPSDRVELTHALVDTLADLHAVDPNAFGLNDFGRAHGFIERQLRRWTSQWEQSRTHDVPAIDELGRRLHGRIPAAQRTAVVHGDYRLDNCVMHRTDPSVVAAVLDWELSALGDPLADLGLLLFYWRTADQQSALTPTVTHLPGFPGREQIIERYATRSGLDVSDVGFYRAFAHFKFAVIAQGIAARVTAGAMDGQDFGDLNSEVEQTAEQGLALV